MYEFRESNFEENSICFNHFIDSFSADIDSFQEEHILKSRVFSIIVDGINQGYFAFCENVFEIEDFTVLTQFVLDNAAINHSQPIFNEIIKEYRIKSAFVSSADQLFLALSMDFHKSVTMQAYMYIDGKAPVRRAEFSRSCMFPAKEEDFPEVKRLSKGYFDFLLSQDKIGRFQLYILKSHETILGFGLLEDAMIMKQTKSLGIYTIEEHRKKGVGRSMMLHLKEICYNQGYKPLTGCNWYNHASKYTIESAGFISKTRLFKVEFTNEKKWVSI
ncbi:hypothetical protein SAMN05421736_104211 [Evansella caseinilytica]|uniref:N-acetyltransferase domain-containing protein n=1 Tax=Evansella caseinilytica TaxID=1503961 RepID=A0A1H3NUN2_9BACI|nr:GNAT family N-acetyltransferase [Evansella caseinilytica]SDY92518.1 hypothetical protein SAMN05421736_104211 [Evansella caseinilytica]